MFVEEIWDGLIVGFNSLFCYDSSHHHKQNTQRQSNVGTNTVPSDWLSKTLHWPLPQVSSAWQVGRALWAHPLAVNHSLQAPHLQHNMKKIIQNLYYGNTLHIYPFHAFISHPVKMFYFKLLKCNEMWRGTQFSICTLFWQTFTSKVCAQKAACHSKQVLNSCFF